MSEQDPQQPTSETQAPEQEPPATPEQDARNEEARETQDAPRDDVPQQPVTDREPTRQERAGDMDEELKVDVDRDKMAEWDKVRDEYSTDSGQEPARPIFSDEGTPRRDERDDDEGDGDARNAGQLAQRTFGPAGQLRDGRVERVVGSCDGNRSRCDDGDPENESAFGVANDLGVGQHGFP